MTNTITNMLHTDVYNREALESAATRDGFGEGLLEAGRADERVVGLTADLAGSTKMDAFAAEFPERFVQVGVAEQNLVTVASGMAHEGKIPFASSFAQFSPGRSWEQIRTTICYNNQPVKVIGTHAGLSVGPDGATHQALEDIAITRALPNMRVIVPVDALQAKRATMAVAQDDKPVYIRLAREKSPVFTTDNTPFEIGKANVYREGTDVTVIATGPLVYEALEAAEQSDLSVEVVAVHTIKPLDAETIIASAKKTGAVVTVEEHQIAGGLGGAVAEVLSENCPVPLTRIGVHDRFGESGEAGELWEKHGLTSQNIATQANEITKRKKL